MAWRWIQASSAPNAGDIDVSAPVRVAERGPSSTVIVYVMASRAGDAGCEPPGSADAAATSYKRQPGKPASTLYFRPSSVGVVVMVMPTCAHASFTARRWLLSAP